MRILLILVYMLLSVACESNRIDESSIKSDYHIEYESVEISNCYKYTIWKSETSESILEEGYIGADDSLKIFEKKVYNENGELTNYYFFNPEGELRFHRSYLNSNEVHEQNGSFYSHNEISSGKCTINDTIDFSIYVASPPRIGSVSIISTDDNQRDIGFQRTHIPFKYSRRMQMTKEGYFVLPFKVVVYDSLLFNEQSYEHDFIIEVVAGK